MEIIDMKMRPITREDILREARLVRNFGFETLVIEGDGPNTRHTSVSYEDALRLAADGSKYPPVKKG